VRCPKIGLVCYCSILQCQIVDFYEVKWGQRRRTKFLWLCPETKTKQQSFQRSEGK
jgi:hypothetical protein